MSNERHEDAHTWRADAPHPSEAERVAGLIDRLERLAMKYARPNVYSAAAGSLTAYRDERRDREAALRELVELAKGIACDTDHAGRFCLICGVPWPCVPDQIRTALAKAREAL